MIKENYPMSKTVTAFLSGTLNGNKFFFLIIKKTQVFSMHETPCMVWQNEGDTLTSVCHGALCPSCTSSSEQCHALSSSLERRQWVQPRDQPNLLHLAKGLRGGREPTEQYFQCRWCKPRYGGSVKRMTWTFLLQCMGLSTCAWVLLLLTPVWQMLFQHCEVDRVEGWRQ